MSTGAEIVFFQRPDSLWVYHHQQYPYGEHEVYHEYGPFLTYEAAFAHYRTYYPNAGGA